MGIVQNVSVGDRPELTSFDAALSRLHNIMGIEATRRIELQVPEVVHWLHERNIAVLVLKGPVTRNRLYGDTEMRPTADIDVMVSAKDFRRAAAELARHGYVRYDRHGHSDAFTASDDRADIDLHLTLPYVTARPTRTFALLAEQQTLMEIDGIDIPVLNVPAHVLHLAIHAAVNRFDTQSRTMTEWRGGLESLDEAQVLAAQALASDLGVREVWEVACRAADALDVQPLLGELPVWEVEARVASIFAGARSGVPWTVRRRDMQRMIALQLSDETANLWRAERGWEPLPQVRFRKGWAKAVRLVDVSAKGVTRISRSVWRRCGTRISR